MMHCNTLSGNPKSISIREAGPREGFQFYPEFIPTEQKLELINALSTSGVKEIEVTSFVRPDLVPQLADCEEISKQIVPIEGVDYLAIYLNKKGYLRSLEFPKITNSHFGSIALSDAFLLENNNTDFEGALKRLEELFELFNGNTMNLAISTTFGYGEEGRFDSQVIATKIAQIEKRFEGKISELCLADTVGIAIPQQIKSVIGRLQDRLGNIPIRLHLHDTYGTGLANAYAGLQMGIDRFDASVGGMGGCPFAKSASGNICTEDFIYLCHESGVETGCDLEIYKETARLAESILKTKLPGRVKEF